MKRSIYLNNYMCSNQRYTMYFDKEIHIDKIYKRHGDYIA